MQITHEINCLADAERALDVHTALAEVFRLLAYGAQETSTPAEPEVEQIIAVEPEPAVKPSKPRRARKTNGSAKAEPQPEPVQAQLDDEDAREKLRQRAVERGVAWLRPILKQFAVQKLSDLTSNQVREVLDAA